MNVYVSLPKNDLELARAAVSAGAHGIKVHLNAFHRASGTTFGGFEQERPFLEELAELPVRKFIMIGQETLPSPDEIRKLGELGFEGFNLYLRHARPDLFDAAMRPILALDHGYTAGEIARLGEIARDRPDLMVEASVVDFKQYGTALAQADLQDYRRIASETGLPVIVPSQKKLLPSDWAPLKETGVDALLLGVIVTGTTAESTENSVRGFVHREPFA